MHSHAGAWEREKKQFDKIKKLKPGQQSMSVPPGGNALLSRNPIKKGLPNIDSPFLLVEGYHLRVK